MHPHARLVSCVHTGRVCSAKSRGRKWSTRPTNKPRYPPPLPPFSLSVSVSLWQSIPVSESSVLFLSPCHPTVFLQNLDIWNGSISSKSADIYKTSLRDAQASAAAQHHIEQGLRVDHVIDVLAPPASLASTPSFVTPQAQPAHQDVTVPSVSVSPSSSTPTTSLATPTTRPAHQDLAEPVVFAQAHASLNAFEAFITGPQANPNTDTVNKLKLYLNQIPLLLEFLQSLQTQFVSYVAFSWNGSSVLSLVVVVVVVVF
jgi:hypothetical protein